MEDKSKLFVFEKKEVILIFVFMVVITVTAFTLGVKVGKGIFLESMDVTKTDIQKTVDLKSVEEEDADALSEGIKIEDSLSDTAKEDLTDLGIEEKLKKEFSEVAGNPEENIEKTIIKEEPKSADIYIDGDANAGKFTIQLVSLETRPEAEKYAEPFVAANYTVVINEASVTGKGTWYRVGIGLFDTHAEAKEYLTQEKSLFRGKTYLINQIK